MKKKTARKRDRPSKTKKKYRIPVPTEGIELKLLNGLTIYVYNSLVEADQRVVVELETDEHPPITRRHIQHDRDGRPQMKVMINEAVVSNDGGEDPVAGEKYTHVLMTGNLSDGFQALGPFRSFDDACDVSEAADVSWVTASPQVRGGVMRIGVINSQRLSTKDLRAESYLGPRLRAKTITERFCVELRVQDMACVRELDGMLQDSLLAQMTRVGAMDIAYGGARGPNVFFTLSTGPGCRQRRTKIVRVIEDYVYHNAR